MSNYNAAAIRSIRSQTDAKTRQTFRSSRKSGLPRIKLSQFMDGQYHFRLWPADDKKNPLGMHRHKIHRIEKTPGGNPFANQSYYQEVTCPRSTNMDPLPIHWEDPLGIIYPQYVDGLDLRPEFRLRCACCEVGAAAAEVAGSMSDSLKAAMAHLAGGDQGDMWFFPVSFRTKIVSKTEEPLESDPGKTWTKIVYGPNPDPTELIHGMLTISEGMSILDKLFRYTEMVPDYGNMLTGRWWWLNKTNSGKGPNGYDVMCEPYASQAGFEIPDNLYPDFSKWGAGGGSHQSTRLDYAVMEGHITQAWWADDLRKLGVALTDSEAAAQAQETGGFNPNIWMNF